MYQTVSLLQLSPQVGNILLQAMGVHRIGTPH
jgi:hypothetical protein